MINKAAKFIKSGGVVAFPTETVYGLGADATNEEACLKIFRLKNRPAINPLIVHVASLEQAKTIGEFNEIANLLATKLWSGPLSLVVPLKDTANIAHAVTAGLKTIALRMPAYPLALELIEKAGIPIAAPSANPSNYISPTNERHVQEHFLDNEAVFILSPESYQSEYGLESTIIDTTLKQPTILREGFITSETLEKILGIKIVKANMTMEVKAPGMLAKHYSPKVPIRLNTTNLEDREIALNFGSSNLQGEFSLNLSISGDLAEAAANLYAYLRMLDNYAISHNITRIAIAPIPSVNIGIAINDRLKRAAF
ncbi:L-threonylcarbamoyladenylate synthase [Rickettsia endosymbiont of Polydrusus tereticollis]|uniref:L-threonylcarbamoyladenylate synthase n=1 Tax=Rickettsia endosymbiont of Polydrusus tereticollis TaxID=3066251 RepID=UPI003132E6A4